MKQFYLSFLLLLTVSVCLNAQSRQFVLFEHFTQASCEPCAEQNPYFQANIMGKNRGNAHHIAYHTSWPGTDPMNTANPQPVQNRVTYYSVTAVPRMIMNGEVKGQPTAIAPTDVSTINAQIAPIEIKVTETGDMDRTVTIEVITTGDISGDYELRTAIVERDVNYTSPPGTNGERDFPNVFRETLNGTGETITLAPMGESVTVTYTYTVDSSWDAEQIYTIAYVQNNATKEVINSGTAEDQVYSLQSADEPFKASEETKEVEFVSSFFTGEGGFFNVKVISSQPEDWETTLTIEGGESTSDEMLISTSPNEMYNLTLNIQPSIKPAVGNYIVEVIPFNETTFAPQRLSFNMISNVWDLVVTNEAGFGDSETYGPFNTLYEDGLKEVDNKYTASMGLSSFIYAQNQNVLGSVKNVYYNVGWTFPSLTIENIAAFATFLDNGGNLLIAGQDIAWETSEDSPDASEFLEDYLHAEYVGDGNTDVLSLQANEADEYFGGLGEVDIDAVYNEHYYPDSFIPLDGATSIFTHNSDIPALDGATGALRFENDTYKVVYLGVGLEMLSGDDTKNDFMSAVHAFFYDGEEADPTVDPTPPNPETAIVALNGLSTLEVIPNPATDVVNLNFNNLMETVQVTFFDVTGKLIETYSVNKGNDNLTLSVQNWATGAYFYQVSNTNEVLTNGKLMVK